MKDEPIVFKITPYDDKHYNLTTADPRVSPRDACIENIATGKLLDAMTMITGVLDNEGYHMPIVFEVERF